MMKKRFAVIIAGCCLFSLAACSSGESSGQPSQVQTAAWTQEPTLPENNETDSSETEVSDPSSSVFDAELENLTGEYDYLSDNGNGKLIILKTSYGYDISDYESESSYRFLANSSNIEKIENNRIYIKYPEQVLSDGTAIFSYYILEYGKNDINVYYKKDADGEEQFLYCAAAAEKQAASANNENNEAGVNNEFQVDFTHDYSEDIKADIDQVVSSSASLQSELENVEAIIQKYHVLAEKAQSQSEMNLSSKWFLVIWDTELNNLWSRFSNFADQQTKEKILADQRNWIDMKDEAILESVGPGEENGSLYPMLVNSFLEEITRNRVYILANELAKIKGESFVMLEKSKYGLFADNQGTGDIYSSLITRQGESGDDEALVSIFGVGEIRGTFVDNGNGELSFTSNDADTRIIKGIIKINGWDGAGFTITEAPDGAWAWYIGKEMDFPFVF